MDEMEDQKQSEEAGEVDAVHSDKQPSSLLPSLAEKSRILSKRERKTVCFEPTHPALLALLRSEDKTNMFEHQIPMGAFQMVVTSKLQEVERCHKMDPGNKGMFGESALPAG